MQIMEAMVSLIFLISFLSIVAADQKAKAIDDSLYKYQLANDVWRVLYLKGDFKDLSFISESLDRRNAENDLKIIGNITGFCIFIGGERLTNCRGIPTQEIVSIERIAIINDYPDQITLSLAMRK